MAVLQMRRISLCALKEDRKAILEKIQSLGIIEVSPQASENRRLQKADVLDAKQRFEKNIGVIEQAIEILEKYSPEKKSLFSSLEGRAVIDADTRRDLAAKRHVTLDVAKEICALDKGCQELKAEITRLENSILSLSPWLGLDVSICGAKTQRTQALIGTLPPDVTTEAAKDALSERFPDMAADIHEIFSDENALYLAVICMKEDAAESEELLRTLGFARAAFDSDAAPAAQKLQAEEFISSNRQRLWESEALIRSLSNQSGNLKALSDYYRIRAEKYTLLGELPQSRQTFALSGYIPDKEAARIAEYLSRQYDCFVEITDLEPGEEAPVLLENNTFSASMEGIVESYGLPRKGEIDPTAIMSFFYVFFFGMMLSDAAYGAVIAIACAVITKKFPRMNDGIKKSIRLFMYCGLSTLAWGILFGGYFGDVIEVIAEKFFGASISVPALWFAPLDDPMKLLLYSLLFGVIHLFTGLAIKGYLCLKDGRITDFICDVVLWYMLLVGLILMLLPSSIFTSIAQTEISFPAPLSILAKLLAIAGAAGIVLMSGRASKSPGLRIALGAYDLYNITSWLSDALSYSRLLALGLATGVIASVINQMGSMVPGNALGVILFIIIFVVGHALNLAINLLGAYVHTNRLQFVEFFGKFYEGGARPFNPFKENTKYTDMKEEI